MKRWLFRKLCDVFFEEMPLRWQLDILELQNQQQREYLDEMIAHPYL